MIKQSIQGYINELSEKENQILKWLKSVTFIYLLLLFF